MNIYDSLEAALDATDRPLVKALRQHDRKRARDLRKAREAFAALALWAKNCAGKTATVAETSSNRRSGKADGMNTLKAFRELM